MTVSEASRLKELEKENIRLKRLLVEQDREVAVLKEFLQKSHQQSRAGFGGFISPALS